MLVPAGPDHPRSRGVYSRAPSVVVTAQGSSPLARGLPVPDTPRRVCPVDHPRSRGVYSASRHPALTGAGSSPLARGLPSSIPWTGRRPEDHPRSRGVYSASRHPALTGAGSSPLARGLRHRPASTWPVGWIIPARAGFTKASSNSSSVLADHPRSRGVYLSSSMILSKWRRIIPARAGFTWWCSPP